MWSTERKGVIPNGLPQRLRRRRPSRLPTVLPTSAGGRYLQRLLWLFGRA